MSDVHDSEALDILRRLEPGLLAGLLAVYAVILGALAIVLPMIERHMP